MFKYYISSILILLLVQKVCGQLEHEILDFYLPEFERSFNGEVEEVIIYEYHSAKSANWLHKNSQKDEMFKKHILKFDLSGNLIYTLSKTYHDVPKVDDTRIAARNYYWENTIKYDSLSRVIELVGIDKLNEGKYWNNLKIRYPNNESVIIEVDNQDGNSVHERVLNSDGRVEFVIKVSEKGREVIRRYEYDNSLLTKKEKYYKDELSFTKEYDYFDNGKIKSSKFFGQSYSGIFESVYEYEIGKSELVKIYGIRQGVKSKPDKIYRLYDSRNNLIKEIDGSGLNEAWKVKEYEIKYRK